MASPLASLSPDIQTAPAPALMGVGEDDEYPERRWYSDWGNFALIALAITAGVYLLWNALEWGNDRTLILVQEVTFVPVMLAGVIFAWRTARLLKDDHRARRAWTLLGFAFLTWLLGDASWAYYLILGENFPYASLVSASYLVTLTLIVSGLLMFPTLGVDGDEQRVFRLDTSIIMLGIVALVAFFVVGPERLRYSEVTVEALGLFVYAVAITSALLIAYRMLVLRPSNGAATPLLVMVIGLTIVSAANLVWTYFEVRGVTLAGGATYSVWMLGQAMLVAGPQVHYAIIRRQRSVHVIDSLVYRSHKLIPYVAAAVGMLVLMSTGLYVLVERMGIVVMLVLGLIALIVIRQIVSLRQNAKLQAAQAVRQTENWFRTLVMYSSDMVTVIDRDCLCQYQSPSVTEVSRYLPEFPIGSHFLGWVHENDRQDVQNALDEIMDTRTDTTTTKIEWRLNAEDGILIHFETIISNRLDDPTVNGLVLNTRDVTERKRLEDRLTYQAFHDPLTGLPNRARFFSELGQAMTRVEPERGVALLFIDIDDFKLINDQFGHETGDRFLLELSRRLQAALGSEDTLSRLAGDEFTILLRDLSSADEAVAVAKRVLQELQRPIQIDNQATTTSASIGIAFTIDPGTDLNDLVHRADTAMYAAKYSGHGQTILHDPSIENSSLKSVVKRNLA